MRKEFAGIIIAIVVILGIGFFIGMGVGGYMAEKPYKAERALLNDQVENHGKDRNALACVLVATSHPTPVDKDWLDNCKAGFPVGDA